MAAPAQSLDIINLALLQLYQAPVTNLADLNNTVAQIANMLYDQCRRSLLRNFIWNFAKVRGQAVLSNTVPLYDYLNAYQIPNGMLRLLWIGYDYHRFCPIPYDINGSLILINPQDFPPQPDPTIPWPKLFILYIQDITDVTQWDPLFIDCMSLSMASKLCMPVTGDRDLAVTLDKAFKGMLAEAQAINHQEKPVIVTENDPIVDARFMSSWGNYQLNIDPSVWGTVDDS